MLDLQLRFSRTLATMLAGAHLASLALVWFMPIPPGVQLLATLLLGTNFIFHLRRDCLLLATGSIVGLHCDQNCQCGYRLRGGEWLEAQLLGSSVVTPWLSVLNLKPEAGRGTRSVILFPDAINADDYRKLRVLLRWAYKDGVNPRNLS